MLPKVKFSMYQSLDVLVYTIQSKSLTAALRRATLLVEAMGGTHAVELEHKIVENKRGKTRHKIFVYVS